MKYDKNTANDFKLRDDILAFWFGELQGPDDLAMHKMDLWFGQSDETDEMIRTHYADHIRLAYQGVYDHWVATPEGRLALVVLLDQFPRNVFRGTPQMYAYDDKALQLVRDGIDMGMDSELKPIERTFFYLPLEHSEELVAQTQCMAMFDRLFDDVPEQLKEAIGGFREYAVAHYEIIARFGRFPHRNDILGRRSTAEEIEFLKQPNSSF